MLNLFFFQNFVPTSLQISHDLCKTAPVSDWLILSFQDGTDKGHTYRQVGKGPKGLHGGAGPDQEGTYPRKGGSGGGTSSCTLSQHKCRWMHWCMQLWRPPTPGEVERRREEVCRLEEVSQVITNPTAGPDGHRGWAIYFGRGGASQKETPAYIWWKGLKEGVPAGWSVEEAPEVPARDCSSPWDPAIPEEHGTPHIQVTLFTCSSWDSPGTW